MSLKAHKSSTYAGIAGPGALGAGLAGMPGAGLLGNDGPDCEEPPGLLGSGGGGARPGLGDGGRLEKDSKIA